jgi:ribonuclease HI
VIQNEDIRLELKKRLEINRKQNEIVFYTDGSLGKIGEGNKASMGYSIVQIGSNDEVVFSFKGKIENWFSSTRAELTACLVTLLLVPEKCKVEIRTDSSCGISAIENCLKNEKTREWLKSKNSNILRAIKKVCESKTLYLRLTKVKAHSGDRYNNLADILAKEGMHSTEVSKINNISCRSVKYIPEWKKVSLETPIRAFVKRIVQVTYKAEWTWIRKKNDEWHQFRIQKQNWSAFRELLESCRKQAHSIKDNHLRLFKIKCIENLLPTVEILNQRRSHIYKNSLCKRCAKEKETYKHLLECEKAQVAMEKIENEAWKQLQVDERKEESWNLISLRQVLSRDPGKKKSQRIEWLRGILNEEDALRIKDMVGSEKMMSRFWCMLWSNWMELFYKEVWKKRCKDMETWEKKEKIGRKDKYAKKKKKGKEKKSVKDKKHKGDVVGKSKAHRVDENTLVCNNSEEIAIDSILREVKEGLLLNWI